MRAILLFIIFLTLNYVSVLAQNSSSGILPTPQKILPERTREQRRQPPIEKVSDSEKRKNKNAHTINFIRRVSLPFRTPLKKQQRASLAPDAQLAVKHSAFLQQGRGGLIKLFPDAGCEDNANIIRVDTVCVNWIPNSAFYSFREKEHTADFLSDITYKNGFLVTDGILSQGILTAIGDVSLESVSLATGGMKFLLDYQPETYSRDALNQFLEISRGLRAGDYEYKKAVPAIENTTYLLRVIAYRGSFYSVYRGRLFDVLYGDKRVDSILALRVLKKNSDGSITLLWKELDRKKSPRVVFPKKKKSEPPKYQSRQVIKRYTFDRQV